MNAPDRASEVRLIVNAHADLFGSDNRRRGILYYVCAGLGLLDSEQWGVLVKGDQGGFIPSDIIVWRPTMEHFDILIGDPPGPAWQPKGVVSNPAWTWQRATTMLFEPGTGPTPAPDPPLPVPIDPPSPPAPLPEDDLRTILLHALEVFGPIVDAIEMQANATTRLSDTIAALGQNGVRLHW
jgi:hypothetical protein